MRASRVPYRSHLMMPSQERDRRQSKDCCCRSRQPETLRASTPLAAAVIDSAAGRSVHVHKIDSDRLTAGQRRKHRTQCGGRSAGPADDLANVFGIDPYFQHPAATQFLVPHRHVVRMRHDAPDQVLQRIGQHVSLVLSLTKGLLPSLTRLVPSRSTKPETPQRRPHRRQLLAEPRLVSPRRSFPHEPQTSAQPSWPRLPPPTSAPCPPRPAPC